MAVLNPTLRRSLSRVFPASPQGVWREIIVVAAILAIAALLRFAAIGSKSFWVDEAYSATIARDTAREIILITARDDAHPPLYYLALSWWSRAFGTNDAALRALGALASTLTVAGTYWLGRRLGGRPVATVAAFLTAVAPFQVFAAQEARMYPLLGLLVLLSWVTLLIAVDGKRWGWVAYVASSTLALYTHYLALLVLLGQAIFVLVAASRTRQAWLVSQLAIILLYLPWLGTFIDTLFAGRGWPFYRPPIGVETITTLLGLLSFGGHAFGFEGWFGGAATSPLAQVAILCPFLGLVALGLIALRNQRAVFWLIVSYLAIPVTVAFLFSLQHNVFYPRYFSFVLPPFALLLAFGIHWIVAKGPPAFARQSTLIFGLTFMLFVGPVLHDVSTNPKFETFNWRGVAALIAANAGPNDLIVVIPAFGSLAFSRYFRGSQRIVPMTPYELGDLARGRTVKDPAAEARSRALFRSYAAHHEVMWIIATGPFPRTAIQRLGNLLEGIYDLRGIATIGAIGVYKTKRHSQWERHRAG